MKIERFQFKFHGILKGLLSHNVPYPCPLMSLIFGLNLAKKRGLEALLWVPACR